MPVVVGSIVVALLAIGGLITAIVLQGGKDDEAGKGDKTGTEQVEGYRPPERNRTMKDTDCSNASEDSNDPKKVRAPSFIYKDIQSAKACAAAHAAGRSRRSRSRATRTPTARSSDSSRPPVRRSTSAEPTSS